MEFINHIRRTTILLILLLVGWAIGCPASAQTIVDVVPDPSTNLTGTDNGSVVHPLEKLNVSNYGITFNFSRGTGVEYPAYYRDGSVIRLYKGNTFTIESTSYTVERVEFQSVAYNSTTSTLSVEIDGDTVYYDEETLIYTWENVTHSNSATFRINDTPLRLSSIKLTLVSNEGIKTLAAPVFSQNSTEFYQPLELTITDINQPTATIYYTLDGSIPSAKNGTKYVSPITIPTGKDVTVRARSVNGNNVSAVTTATYTYVPKHLLSVKFPNKNGFSRVYYSSNSEYGEFKGDGSVYITEGEKLYVGFSLNSGYKCSEVTINGNVQSSSGSSLSFVMPSTDVELVINAVFDPYSPTDPESGETADTYTLYLASNPMGAFSLSGAGRYTSGKQVNVYAGYQTGYVFTGWTKDGETISTSNSFNYTMPSSDVVLTANYVFNPSSPSDPQQPTLKHPLTVIASPANSGTFGISSSEVTYGQEYIVYAYPKSGYKFKGWIVNGVAQEETSAKLTGIMTEAGAQVVGLFVFDPSSPSNPGANYYDDHTGDVIIDDFTPGNLHSALVELIDYYYDNNVRSIIVKGIMAPEDYGALRRLTNVGTIDLSRTGGDTEVPLNAFYGLPAKYILLPSTITNLGDYVFCNCSNLTSLTLYAQVPPQCTLFTFNGWDNRDNCTLFVPEESVGLYNAADYWKDFTILPITDDAHVLQVNLPADATDGRYKNNSIELVNLNSGVRQKYVISDRCLYTFNGLRKDEQYNIYMLSQAGLELGRIENITVPNEDFEVTFDKLKPVYTVCAEVITPDGKDVTYDVIIEWLKPMADGKTSYLRKATSLGEIPEGQALLCRVSLNNQLGSVYAEPEEVKFTVSDEMSTCAVKLKPFREIVLSGRVVDGEGMALSRASVSINQTLNGKYSKSYTTKTDRQGKWSLSVLDAPETRLTYSASECVNANDTIGAFEPEVSTLDLGTKTLRSIAGARVTYGFTYLAAGSEYAQDYYSDYENVIISVFNVSQNRSLNEVSLQYPILAVLDENINTGDVLLLTASSKTGAFNPIAETVTVDENQRAEVTFDLIGKGGIDASFEMTDNPAVVAMLYSGKGELLKQMTYSEAKATFIELEDGEYTLVSMGQSDLIHSILRLSNFSEIGLTEGNDYVKNTVKVKSGKLSEIKNAEIPAFDESLFTYTNSSTSFTSNKSSITTGDYITLRANIDFKNVYKSDIKNVSLVVDLPEACDFVGQSVIQGSNLLPYVLDNKRLTIQLGNNYQSQIRFCVIPTNCGLFNATASVVFDYNDKSLMQPIGSAFSEIKDLEIVAPSVTADSRFTVSGSALAKSEIKIIEDGTVLGTCKANAAGLWSATCEFVNPYNLSKHQIFAEITTPSGTTIVTETKSVTYDINAIQVSKVNMYYWNQGKPGQLGSVDSEFDFLNPKISATNWVLVPSIKQFTYTIEFTKNDPERISNVILYVHTANGKFVPVDASYDEKIGMWYAMFDMGSSINGYYPVNCSVDFANNSPILADRNYLDSQIENLAEDRKELLNEVKEIESIFASDDSAVSGEEQLLLINSLLSSEEYDFNELSDAISGLIYGRELSQDVDQTTIDAEYQSLVSDHNEWSLNYDSEVDSLFSAFYVPTSDMDIEYVEGDMESILNGENGKTTTYRSTKISSVNHDELISQGYDYFSLTDQSNVYYHYGADTVSFIDGHSLMRYDLIQSGENSNTSRARKKDVDWNALAPCIAGITGLIRNLGLLILNPDDQNFAASFSEIVNDLMDATQCAYTNALFTLGAKIAENHENAVNAINAKIANRQKVINKIFSDMDNMRGQLSSLNKRMSDITIEEANLKKLLDNGDLPEATKVQYKQRIEALNYEFRLNADAAAACEARIGKSADQVLTLEKQIGRLNLEKLGVEELFRLTSKTLKKFPASLSRGLKLGKTITTIGKLAGPFGVLLEAISLFSDGFDALDEVGEWNKLYETIKSKIPCENNEFAAEDLLRRVGNDRTRVSQHFTGIIIAEAGALLTDIYNLSNPQSEVTKWCFIISGSLNGYAEVTKYWAIKNYFRDRVNYRIEYGNLRCGESNCGGLGQPPCPGSSGGGNGGGGSHSGSGTGSGGSHSGSGTGSGGSHSSGAPNDNVAIDPSGFVFEAVPENRIEGVQATIYYKETKEDMYGDLHEEVVLWDAEEYAQENPLFTDENGMYRWDVPQGLWQVKFEKDGYLTAYSEWLPVPPPQLEVNIGIVQNKQPEVTEARAYEEGVEVQFDKFMDLSTLNTGNIYVTANGEKLNGSIRFIDYALADEFAAEEDEDAARYASRIRFVPEENLSATTGEIRVTVSRNVRSYAGIPMTETFSQVLDVEKEVQVITASDVKVLYGGEKEVTIYALPYDAAVGRTLRIASSSDLITSVDKTEAIIDDEGKATVMVKGNLPGCAQLTFSIDDVTVTGDCAVDVVTEILSAEAPKSSRASGTAVYRGAKVELTTDTKDGVIYFTTDGSCPCDENGTRRKYTVPIIINDDTKILAITIVGTAEEDMSEIVEFNYTLKHNDMDFAMSEGWSWISHNFETPVPAEKLADDESVQRIMSQNQELIRDPQLGMVGMLQELNASESYKVETSSATARQRLSDVAWNPANPISIISGWNWLGYPVSQTMSVDEALATTAAENLDVIVGQKGFAQFDGENWIGTLETLSPGLGYMYQSQSDKSVIYNTSIVSTAAARYVPGISQNSPLVLDIHKYASIMPVVATLKSLNGTNLDNDDYQVNAFCDSECRGIGRIVNGLVMMNVYGNANDKITFQVTDKDGSVMFDNNATLSFSEQIVGNLYEPYVISINSQSGVNDVTYEGNVKVSVVEDMLVIKGIAPEDIKLVEVYDMEGQKIIHATKVTETGIRISNLNAGVFIVIVNGNGEYTYHKIALR